MAQPLTRDRPIAKGRAALLIIDVQNGTFGPAQSQVQARVPHPRHPQYKPPDRGVSGRRPGSDLHGHREPDAGRARPQPRLQAFGFQLCQGLVGIATSSRRLRREATRSCCPRPLPPVFNSTTLDYLLRNIGIEDVFVVGFLTDQCIDHAIRDGADRGYYMTCVHDAMHCRHGGPASGCARRLQGLLPHAHDRRATEARA